MITGLLGGEWGWVGVGGTARIPAPPLTCCVALMGPLHPQTSGLSFLIC